MASSVNIIVKMTADVNDGLLVLWNVPTELFSYIAL